ncbi:MAG: 50S ribosomal protein L10 [Bacteroidota bacterium]
MNKQQKSAAIEDILAQLEGAAAVYMTDYSGLTVEKSNDLRNKFREAGVEYKVLKNTLVRLAMERLGGYEAAFEYLHGPTAVAFSEDPSAPARVIKKYLKDNDTEKPAFKGAVIEGSVFTAEQLDALASLKSKEELIGDILGLLLAPITNVVGGLQAQGSNLLGAIQTIAEKEEG